MPSMVPRGIDRESSFEPLDCPIHRSFDSNVYPLLIINVNEFNNIQF